MDDLMIDADFIEFITPPPEFLRLKCPVCLELLLEDPYLVSCCGTHFCGNCLSNSSINKCPYCSSSKFNKIPDKSHQRAIGSLSICCLAKQDGCQWEGELSKLKKHMSKEGECQYVNLPCPHGCGKKIHRQSLKDHEENCIKRPTKCEHCKVYESTWENVVGTHYSVCPEYPVTCPAPLCGEVFLRRDSEGHASRCTMQSVECDYSQFGCKWSGPRGSAPSHLESNWRKHIQLVSMYNYRMIQEQQKQLNILSELVARQNKQISKQETLIKELTKQIQTKTKSSAATPLVKPVAKPEVDTTTSLVKPPSNLMLYDFIMKGFSSAKLLNEFMQSCGIYLSQQSPCFEVLVYPNGIGRGLHTHVSVYLHIVPGVYDDKLNWPYEPEAVELRLFDHIKHKKSHGKVIIFDSKSNLLSRMRPKDSTGCKGVGFDQFITQSEILRYVHNNELKFELAFYV